MENEEKECEEKIKRWKGVYGMKDRHYSMEEKINKLGSSFRGLWRNCYQLTKEGEMRGGGWCLTFIYKGEYAETPGFSTANEALDFAINLIGDLENENNLPKIKG